MVKKVIYCLALLSLFGVYSQKINTPYQSKKIVFSKDSIKIDSVSINKSFFKLLDHNGNAIDTTFYSVNYQKGVFLFRNNFSSPDTITVKYLNFPKELTKVYSIYDKSRIVSNNATMGTLYKVLQTKASPFVPFDGLTTSGSISRGITIGNTQNTSVNSNLDLQISGKISNKVSLRASIQDSNIPLQEGGYSQKLDEFDQVFIELFSDKWSIRAGDLFLENRKSKFLNFNKKVQGISTQINLGTPEKKTEIYASGALVRGQYAKSDFIGQEGNQGPYKLRGANGELYVLVISGSERVYVNGVLLKRGENNQYTIDYNAGEITFTSIYPITSEMRISIEYQYSDRSYTRLVTYFGANYTQEKWSLSGYLYSENDIKNQNLQQNLSESQIQILANAGDNPANMVAPSEELDSYSANKILYKKITLSGNTYYEYSTNSADILYRVKFLFVGNNVGNYVLETTNSNGRVYKYVAPMAGILQGNYEPIIKLIPPTKIQIATIVGKINPNEKTNINFEIGISNQDKNLYSPIEDSNNQGVAGYLDLKKRLLTKKWQVDMFANYQLIQNNFATIERINSIEFDRDWNLENPSGNQSMLSTGIVAALNTKSQWKYQFEKLDYKESFDGNRQTINGFYKLNNWLFSNKGSFLASKNNTSASKFIRYQAQTKYHFYKNWIGASIRHENNQEKNKITNLLQNSTQRFTEYGTFLGRGDSTKVYTEIGYLHRINDSLQLGKLNRVNKSNSFYIKSKVLQTDKSDLSIFINYRKLHFENVLQKEETSLNSRILYNDQFFNQFLQTSFAYENTSGTIPQQEFSFVEVEAGKGIYTWNDYNSNGIQELQEFEIAPFPDLAKYIKVYLPNQIYIKTHQNKFSQSLVINPISWKNKDGIKHYISYLYNQTSYLIERKEKREGNQFNLNPFQSDTKNLLGLTMSFRNSLYYNKGKQNHSTTYTFISNKLKSLQSFGEQESNNLSHQLQYNNLIKTNWLLNITAKNTQVSTISPNYASQNYFLKGNQMEPKISYLFTKNTSLDLFYEFKNIKNDINNLEKLKQTKYGIAFTTSSNQKLTLNGVFSYYNNIFTGNEISPVGFQMLEGLQPGINTTWQILLQKNLTQYLDININYMGRKTETSSIVHTGNIQLRALF